MHCTSLRVLVKGHAPALKFLLIFAVFFSGTPCAMGAMGAAAARRPARGTREGHSRGNSVLATMSLWGAHGTTMVIADGYPLADAGFAMVEQEHEEHAYMGDSPADPAADYLLSPECLNHIREGGGVAAVAYASLRTRAVRARRPCRSTRFGRPALSA